MQPEQSHNIFNRPLRDVTFDDVVSFCQLQHSEGINLDYKQEVTKELTKTISAFANTNGGWIIVGVVDENDKPKLPAEGMDYDPSLESRVIDMLISNMWPYFRPFMHLCPPNKDNKTFLLIYVPESLAAPHWVFNRSRLYIRKSDKTPKAEWEEQANADIWEMLRNKREKSINLRKSSKRDLDFIYYLKRDENRSVSPLITGKSSWESDAVRNMLSVYVQPLFPVSKLSEVDKVSQLFHECERQYTGELYPHLYEPISYYADGAYLYSNETISPDEFLGIDVYGTIVSKYYPILKTPNAPHTKYVQLYSVVVELWKVLTFSADAYQKLGYVGMVNIDIVLDIPPNTLLQPATGHTRTDRKNIQGYVRWEGQIEDGQVYNADERKELMKLILKRIYLSFNAPSFGDEQLEHVLTDSGALRTI